MIAYRYLPAALILSLCLAASAQQRPADTAPLSRWIRVAPSGGRLHAAQLGLVINTADPYSVEVGSYYAKARALAPSQVLRLDLPTRGRLNAAEFETLREAIATRFGDGIQALALAWTAPFAVDCQSITGALALGLDPELCRHTCAASQPSPYYAASTARPWSEFGLRPSMLLAAATVDQAKALIDRGVASDGSLRWRGRPPVSAMFLVTPDRARNVRMATYPPAGLLRTPGVEVRVAPAQALATAPRVLLAITGSVHLDLPATVDWVPGALADHLTSSGGVLDGSQSQSTVLEWIASGATASYGTVSEPCNHLQKFPQPQLLLLNYLQGSTAIEAYWKSVAWPEQGLFVGEPLAAPFARR